MSFLENVLMGPFKTVISPITQGIQSLTNPNFLGDVGKSYVQGKIMEKMGMQVPAQLQGNILRNRLGSTMLGGLDGGLGSLGPVSGRTGGLFPTNMYNKQNKEAIKAQYGFAGEKDEDLLQWYSNLHAPKKDKKGDVIPGSGMIELESLSPEDLRKLLMIETLMKPDDIIMGEKQNYRNAQEQARADVAKQFGGRFQTYDMNQLYPTYTTPKVGYSQGGIADLRGGGQASGPGTGTSDSIPARLSDGEFVMTAKAVRGAGNGDRAEGVRKMYALMNELQGIG